jgi:nitric oxide reductase subunit C
MGSAGALALCLVLALAANAIYWTVAGPPAEAAPLTFADLPAGNADAGLAVFNTEGCTACHSLEPDKKIVGPSLAGVSARAATRKPGLTAEEYLFESILSPTAYTVEGFSRGTMPSTFRMQLSDQELADVIALLMAQ